jgi:hypothetical protein
MERSFAELETIFSTMGFDPRGLLFRGAAAPLPDKNTPADSEGARLIIREAMSDDPRPLFVTFLGPLTDLASAYNPGAPDRRAAYCGLDRGRQISRRGRRI